MSRPRLFLLGFACQLFGGAGVALLIWWGPVGWTLIALWFIAVAWAAANIAVEPRVLRTAGLCSLWGALGCAVCGAIVISGLAMLAGINPHGGPTLFGDVVLAGLNGGLAAAGFGAGIGFVAGASVQPKREPSSDDAKTPSANSPDTRIEA